MLSLQACCSTPASLVESTVCGGYRWQNQLCREHDCTQQNQLLRQPRQVFGTATTVDRAICARIGPAQIPVQARRPTPLLTNLLLKHYSWYKLPNPASCLKSLLRRDSDSSPYVVTSYAICETSHPTLTACRPCSSSSSSSSSRSSSSNSSSSSTESCAAAVCCPAPSSRVVSATSQQTAQSDCDPRHLALVRRLFVAY